MNQGTSIILGGGCFWCLEAILKSVKGIQTIEPGYAGGHTSNPTYKEVCQNDTGHAEVVRVVFDPSVISLETILKLFFVIHDPTSLNRQGDDIGTQYRSIILCNSEAQEKTAFQVRDEVEKSGIWKKNFVTEIKKVDRFYPAETEHKNYFELHPEVPYCQMVIEPKVSKFRKNFMDYLKK